MSEDRPVCSQELSASGRPVCAEDDLPLYLTLKQFRDRVFPIGNRTVWRLISVGQFPRPAARVGGKTAVWRTADLLEWVEDQERRERTHRPNNLDTRRK